MPVIPASNPALPVGNLVDRVRRELLSLRRGEYNILTSSITEGSTAITFTDALGGIAKSAYVGIEDELVLVRSVSGQAATVLRGMLGTTPANHAAGVVVEVSPRFVRGDILDRMKEEILSWPKDLYRVPTAAVLTVSNPTVRGYDLAIGDYYDILEVRRSPANTLSGSWPRVRNWEAARGLPTADFPSGQAIFLKDTPPVSTASRISVVYAAAFNLSSWSEATDLANCGLVESMLDLLQYGTTWRVAATREIVRTDLGSQGEARVKDEVPPMHTTNAAQYIKKLRDERLNEEIDKLRRVWGIRQA